MKNLNLSPAQRLGLLNILNEQYGKADQMATVFRVIEKIRITEEEQKSLNLQLKQVDNRMELTWDPGVKAQKKINLEDKDAEILLRVVNSWEKFSPLDTPWIAPILEALTKGS